jgi:hypothetical protein
MLWSALRSSRVGRSWESKCSCHCVFEGLAGGAGAGRCFLSLICCPFRAISQSPIVLGGHSFGKSFGRKLQAGMSAVFKMIAAVLAASLAVVVLLELLA